MMKRLDKTDMIIAAVTMGLTVAGFVWLALAIGILLR